MNPPASQPVVQSENISQRTDIVAQPRERIYVTDINGPVAAYASSSNGTVKPILTITDPNSPNAVWNPWGVTFDNAGNLYVQSFLSDATTYVFPPGAHAGTKPTRLFKSFGGPDSRSIAVDSRGFEYVATSEESSQIGISPPGASGVASDLYFVAPLRVISTTEQTWFPWPDLLTVDSQNDVVAAIVHPQFNAIEVYAGGTSTHNTPIRKIAGLKTALGSCPGATCDHIVVTFSPFTRRFYVGVSAGANTHVSVFSESANGDVAPIRTIQGDETGLSNKVITGIADSQRTGDIYVMAKDAQFFAVGRISVFARLANGDVSPLRSFVDAKTGFSDAAGIAITR